MAPIHHYDGVGSQPPIARMRSDAEVHVTPIAETAMESETFMRLCSVAKHTRAARHGAAFIYARAGMSFVAANSFFAINAGPFFRFVHVFLDVTINVRPCPFPFSWLNVLLCSLTRLSVLFGFGRLRLLRRLLLLFVSRRLSADRYSDGKPDRY